MPVTKIIPIVAYKRMLLLSEDMITFRNGISDRKKHTGMARIFPNTEGL